ncbi:hypothetical protein D0861_05596 [Hortaea werneckii]|uniref:Uncharacterized protein n=1 Tax=Hortaea werneckii TaxID=91943 RepID=A0A3M7FDV9_HORWE|nr:hypothetical protein D0861_05596 [Hortaea werneckii]
MNVAGRALGTEKGRRYLAQLDQALCDGKWAEVAELARKTEKHAPEKHYSVRLPTTDLGLFQRYHEHPWPERGHTKAPRGDRGKQ